MTLNELKSAIQQEKASPSQLFEAEDLVNDPVVRAHVKQQVSGEYAHRKRVEEASERDRIEWDKKEKELQVKIDSHSKIMLKAKAKETFDAILVERPKLKEDVRLMKFIQKGFDKSFTPVDEAKVKDELNKFVDGQVVEFAELMGEGKAGNGKEKTDAEKAAEATAAAAEEKRDKANLLDPKNNELIPAV